MVTSSVEIKLEKIRQNMLKLEEEERRLKSKLNREHIDSVVATIKKYDLSLEDIKAALEGKPATSGVRQKRLEKLPKVKKDRKIVAPKYQNPANASDFWTGRGRAPLWADALKKAGQLDTALIVKS